LISSFVLSRAPFPVEARYHSGPAKVPHVPLFSPS
jgi:hypothetical protein